MKEGWEFKKLGEVAEIVGGSTPKTDIEEYWGGSYFWVTPAELNGDKYIDSTERTITDKAIQKTNLSLLPAGTVLLSSRAPIGKVCITKVPMYCNQGFKNVVCSEKLINDYVYYFLKNNVDYLQSLGTGATFKEISKKVVETVKIPLPPLEEQIQIASELDLLSGVIEKQKAQLEELDKLAQSIFYDMFGDPVTNEKGWKCRMLSDIASFKNGINYHDGDNGFAIKCIGVGDFKNNTEMRNFDDVKIIQVEEKIDENYIIKEGDILIVRSNGSKDLVGRNMIVYTSGLDLTYSGFCIRCRVKDTSIVPLLLSRILANRNTMRILRQEGQGCNISNINQKILSSLSIISPPLFLQQEFAAKVEAIESMKAKVRQSLKEAETLLNSRMDYYFN